MLKSFKAVHRARTYIFEGDPHALDKARQEINENYKKNKNETDSEKVRELIKLAYDVAAELRTSVLKMSETKSGRLCKYVHQTDFEIFHWQFLIIFQMFI